MNRIAQSDVQPMEPLYRIVYIFYLYHTPDGLMEPLKLISYIPLSITFESGPGFSLNKGIMVLWLIISASPLPLQRDANESRMEPSVYSAIQQTLTVNGK